MNPGDEERLLAKFNGNPPIAASSIRQVETDAGLRLPDDYVNYLRRMNGGEGFVGNAYLILWSAEELIEMNKAYQVDDYAPGLLLFGSDGGGEAFAFDMRSDTKPIVSVPFVGMDLKAVRSVALDFTAFLEEMFKF